MSRPKWKKQGLPPRGPGRPTGTGTARGGIKAAEKRRGKKWAQIRCTAEFREELIAYAEAFSRFHPTGTVLSQPLMLEVIAHRYRKDLRNWLGMDNRLKPEDFESGGRKSS
jgi:hypothetical protein